MISKNDTITNDSDCKEDLATNVKDLGWDRVLEDAETGLAQAKARVRILSRTIRTIRQKIAAGDPFPKLQSRG
jgi:hypothetical protein